MTFLNAWLSHHVNYNKCQHHQFQQVALQNKGNPEMVGVIRGIDDALWGGNVLILAPKFMTKQLHPLKYLMWGETVHLVWSI
jgi:hypothetical protein